MPIGPRVPLLRLLAFSSVLILAVGCGSGTTAPTDEDPTISLSITPSSATVEQGGSVMVTGTATVGGSFTGTATVTVSNVPTGVTGTVGTPAVSGNVTTVPVTIMVGASVTPGAYAITVRVAGSGVSDEQTFNLTVTEGPSFTLAVTPAELSIEQGTSDDASVALSRTNFTGSVDLSASGAPSGMSVSFDPTSVSGDAAALTVTVGGSVAAGTYTLTIRGVATGTSVADATDELAVTVTEPVGPAYSLSVTPDELMLDQADSPPLVQGRPALASSGSVMVELERVNGHTATVGLDVLGAPEGVTATFSPVEVTGDASELTIDVGASVVPDTYVLTIRGQDGELAERTTPLTLVIGAAPSYELGLDPAELSIEQGAMGSTTVSLDRVNFEDAVTLSVEDLPTGVTGSFSANPTTGTTSTLTLTAGAGATPGAATVTVRGTTGALDDVTVTLDLTITEPVGFSLGSIAAITIQQGQSAMRTVAIERTGGFDGSVTVTVTPTVSGLTMTPDPSSTTGDSFVLTAAAGGSLAPETYSFEVKGNASGQPESVTTVDVTVIAASSDNVQLDYSTCSPDEQPIWMAFKDGAGAWTEVTGSGGVFSFNVTQSTVGVVTATAPSIFDTDVQVAYMTQAELVGDVFGVVDCSTPTTKTVDFVATGLATSEGGSLYLGGGAAFFSGAGSAFQINSVQLGTFDAIGFVQDFVTPGAERAFIRRDQDVTDLGTIDFSLANSEVVAAASATLTVGDLMIGETYAAIINYNTSTVTSMCMPAMLSTVSTTTAPTFTALGIPSGSQAGDESHSVNLTAIDASNNARSVTENIGTLAATTVELPAPIPAPTVSNAGGGSPPYKILSATVAMPSEYNSYSSFEYDANGKYIGVAGSAAYLGTGSQTLTVPDLSGVSGFQTSWVPADGDEVSWALFGTGGALANACSVGYRGVTAVIEGTES